jgi:acyl-CoA synthetase (AMP-forming)/AMP-acid ligase II
MRHLESWYGIMGIGAVCHTLNPRLFLADLEYIINHAEDCVILYDITFIDLVNKVTALHKGLKTWHTAGQLVPFEVRGGCQQALIQLHEAVTSFNIACDKSRP